MKATCPNCQSQNVEREEGFVTTLAGCFSTPGHDHDNNCVKKGYNCVDCGYRWAQALRRRCPAPDCDFTTKETCFCFKGQALFEWPEAKVKSP
jgi:hypothetical protein